MGTVDVEKELGREEEEDCGRARYLVQVLGGLGEARMTLESLSISRQI